MLITYKDLWLQAVAIILPEVKREFNPSHVEYTTMALYVGLIVGATTWVNSSFSKLYSLYVCSLEFYFTTAVV
jgi:hypothetical protein